MSKEKVEEQLAKIFQDFWDEHHILIRSAKIDINWIESTPFNEMNDYKISKLVIKTD